MQSTVATTLRLINRYYLTEEAFTTDQQQSATKQDMGTGKEISFLVVEAVAILQLLLSIKADI
jgi:hypothetical protein